MGPRSARVRTVVENAGAQTASVMRQLPWHRGAGTYDPMILEALVAGHKTSHRKVRELPIAAIRVGMILVDDVRLRNGTLLVARGYEVTRGFVERVRNLMTGQIEEPVRVLLPAVESR